MCADEIEVVERQRAARQGMQKRWYTMIEYCTNPRYDTYQYVGAKGITVCNRWLDDFDTYLEDVGYPPGEDMFLERIDKSKNFEPGNMRWVTKSELMRNTSQATIIDCDGEKMSIAEAAERYGIKYSILVARLSLGWPVEDALSKPVKEMEERVVIYLGQPCSLTELSELSDLPVSTLYARIFKMNWAIDRALEEPRRQRRLADNLAMYTYQGRTLSLRQWGVALKINYSTLVRRLARNNGDHVATFAMPLPNVPVKKKVVEE